MFYSITCFDWYRWWKHGRTRACLSPALAARRRYVQVLRPLLATATPDKKRTGSAVTMRTYQGYLG